MELEAELDSLRAARKAAAVSSLPFANRPVVSPSSALAVKADEVRGCQVFVRDLSQAVLPDSEPRPGEATGGIEAFASPGQYETLTFAVKPLRDLGDVRVRVSDLSAGWRRAWQGGIPSSSVEVGVGRYLECLTGEAGYNYQVLPRVVQPRDPMPLRGDMTVRWWLRVHVPEGTAPGDYRGAVRVETEKGPGFSLPLRLRVLPIQLEPVPIPAGLYHFDYVYWYTHFWQRTFGDDPWLRARVLEHERQNMQMLRRYGINSLSMTGEDLRNEARYDGDQLKIRDDGPFSQWMDLYASAGMKAMPWYGFESVGGICLPSGNYGRKVTQFSPEWERDFVSVAHWVKQQEKARGWPEVILTTSDELSNDGAAGAERGVKTLQAINRGRGDRPWRTLASVNGPYERSLVPLLSIIMPNHAYPITGETLAEIHRQKTELWLYNVGTSRATWGFYPWAIGARGRFQWFNCQIRGDPWNSFGCDSAYTITRTTPGEPLPSPELFEISEGLNDLRYLATLEKRIAEAAASPKPKAREAAAAARKDLDDLRRSIPVDARTLIGQVDAASAGVATKGEWANHALLNQKRLLVAEAILRLQKSMK